MATNFELVVLYHPDLEIDLDKALNKVESIISDSGGKILHSDNWGKRHLAYPVNRQNYAVYVYYELELDNKRIGEIEKLLNITDEVIRYLIAKPTPNFGDREKARLSDDSSEESEKKDATKAKPKATPANKKPATKKASNDKEV